MKMKEQMNKRGKMKMKKEDIISFTWHQPSDFSMNEDSDSWWGFFWIRERMSLFYLFQTVIYFQLKRKLKQINLVKQIIFYYLCSYLCTQIYNQKGNFMF